MCDNRQVQYAANREAAQRPDPSGWLRGDIVLEIPNSGLDIGLGLGLALGLGLVLGFGLIVRGKVNARIMPNL